MAFANSEWIVKLHYAFQDVKNVSIIRSGDSLMKIFSSHSCI